MATVGTTDGRILARIHWSAVIAGALFGIGVHIVMGLIGAALGFAAQPAGSSALGAGAAAWALLTPFVATLCGAWLAIRLAGEQDDRTSGYVHGILVWSIGIIAGAMFIAGAAATGAMAAEAAAADGTLGPAQRMARGVFGQANPTGRPTEAQLDRAGRAAAASTGGAALAALAGLLGAVVATGVAGRRSAGRGHVLRWRIAIQRTEERRAGAHAGAPGRYGETGYRPATPGTYGPGARSGEAPRDEGATDPYRH